MPSTIKQFRKSVNKLISFAFLPLDLALDVISLLGMSLFISKSASSRQATEKSIEMLDKVIQACIYFAPFQNLMIYDFETIYNNKVLDEYFSRFKPYNIVKQRYEQTGSIYTTPQPLDYVAGLILQLFKEIQKTIDVIISILREAPITRLLFQSYEDKITENDEQNLFYCINKLYSYVNIQNENLAEITPDYISIYYNALYQAFRNVIFTAIMLMQSYEQQTEQQTEILNPRHFLYYGNLKIKLKNTESAEETTLYDDKALENTYTFKIPNLKPETSPFILELNHEGFKIIASPTGNVKVLSDLWLNENYDFTNNRFNPAGRTLIALTNYRRLIAIRPNLEIAKVIELPELPQFLLQNYDGKILAFRTTDNYCKIYVISPKLNIIKTIETPFTRMQTIAQFYVKKQKQTYFLIYYWRQLEPLRWRFSIAIMDSKLNIITLNFQDLLNLDFAYLAFITPEEQYLISHGFNVYSYEPIEIRFYWALRVYDQNFNQIAYSYDLAYTIGGWPRVPLNFGIPCVRLGDYIHFTRITGDAHYPIVRLSDFRIFDSDVSFPVITNNRFGLSPVYFSNQNYTEIRVINANQQYEKIITLNGNASFNHGAINFDNVALLSGNGVNSILFDMDKLEVVRILPIPYTNITGLANNRFYAVRDNNIIHVLNSEGEILNTKSFASHGNIIKMIAIPQVL